MSGLSDTERGGLREWEGGWNVEIKRGAHMFKFIVISVFSFYPRRDQLQIDPFPYKSGIHGKEGCLLYDHRHTTKISEMATTSLMCIYINFGEILTTTQWAYLCNTLPYKSGWFYAKKIYNFYAFCVE